MSHADEFTDTYHNTRIYAPGLCALRAESGCARQYNNVCCLPTAPAISLLLEPPNTTWGGPGKGRWDATFRPLNGLGPERVLSPEHQICSPNTP